MAKIGKLLKIHKFGRVQCLRDVTKAPQDVQKQYGTNATILNSTTATVIQVCFFSCLLK